MKTCKNCKGEGTLTLSDCCGADGYSNGDGSLADYGICSDCHDHCLYEEVICECCNGKGEIEDENNK
jgi:hypothetical protein